MKITVAIGIALLLSFCAYKLGRHVGASAPDVDGPIVGRYIMDVPAWTSCGRYGSSFDHPAHTDYYFVVRNGDGSATSKVLVSKDMYDAMKDGQAFKVN